MSQIILKNITKFFGSKKVLDDVSLVVDEGGTTEGARYLKNFKDIYK